MTSRLPLCYTLLPFAVRKKLYFCPAFELMRKKAKPLISIILPVQNSSRFLRDCLESLTRQSEKRWEIIAIDDLSKDSSFEILKTYKKREKRLRAYKNKKRYGLAITLNRAVRRTKGRFITFMNPNDLTTKTRLKKQLKHLLSNPRAVVVGTQCIFIDKKGKKLGKSEFPKEHEAISQALLPGLSMEFETAMINREALPKDILKFNPNAKSFIYTDLFLKITQYGELANLKQCLQFHRKNSENISKLNLNYTASLIKLCTKSIAMYVNTYEFRLIDFFLTTIRILRLALKSTTLADLR